ncbi:MAG: hypothetical protein R3C14_20640 [Caldilineaceae bacterium]
MDKATWQARLRHHLTQTTGLVQRMVPGLTYGALATASLLPIVDAVKGGDLLGSSLAVNALVTTLGNVGVNLITNIIQEWKDRDDAETLAELPPAVTAAVATNKELRAAFDKLINELDAVRLAVENAPLPDPASFLTALRTDLQELGSTVTITGNYNIVGHHNTQINTDLYAENYVAQQTILQAPTAPLPRPDRYLQRLRNHCHALPLTAMGGDATAGDEVTLDKVYIDLDTTTTVELSEEAQEERDEVRARGRGKKEHIS